MLASGQRLVITSCKFLMRLVMSKKLEKIGLGSSVKITQYYKQ